MDDLKTRTAVRRRELPDDSWLAYRRIAAAAARPYAGGLQMVARRDDRYARWSFIVWRTPDGDLTLDINGNRGWLAFAEVPEVFADLAALDVASPRFADLRGIDEHRAAAPTLDRVRAVFVRHGALDDTE